MRNGDFSELLNAANPFFKKVRTVTDPLNGAPFPGNIIPAGRISHNGQALLNILPAPVPGFLQGSANWIGTKSTHSDLRKDNFKVDYLITQNEHLLGARHAYSRGTSTLPSKTPSGVWRRSGRARTASARSA